jgi:AcrR family transcriptional regulator
LSADSNNGAQPVRRGRRLGESGSKQAILAAARTRFADDGYAATTIRRVAADAGVNAALVMQFFRSKEELFAAVMSIPSSALSQIANAFDGPSQTLGERVTRALLGLWEGPPEESEPLLAMLRAAISNEHASLQLRDFVQKRLLETIGPKLGNHPDSTIRAGLASAMLVGVIFGRRMLQIPALADEAQERVIRLIGPAIQIMLTCDKTG